MEREEEGGGTGGAEPCGTEKTENGEEMWLGGAKGRRRRRRTRTRREGNFIWFRLAATTTEKMMRTPLAPEMVTAVGEWWRTATERLPEYNRP